MTRKASTALLIVVIAACLYGCNARYERYEQTIDLGWNQAALRNPYLAAELFLRRLDIDVQSHSRFDKLVPLPENGAIFVSDSRHVFSGRQIRELTQWIKRGGHLIVAASAPGDSKPDRLLASFAIENRATHVEPAAHNEQAPSPAPVITADDEDDATPENELSRLQADGIDTPLTLHFLPTHQLYHPAFDRHERPSRANGALMNWAGDQQGIHFIQLQVGRGRLSVLSDSALWRSDWIDRFDHAFFLRLLVHDRNDVRLLYGAQMPSLMLLLWRHASPLLIASALWLAAWLVYRGRRFGPIVEQQITGRRSMAEHVLAGANYLWNGGWHKALLRPVQDDIQRHARRTVPNYDQLDESTQYQRLSASSGVPQWRVEDAMRSVGKPHEHHFVEIIQCLQQIRKSL